jgi:hypothetical protein
MPDGGGNGNKQNDPAQTVRASHNIRPAGLWRGGGDGSNAGPTGDAGRALKKKRHDHAIGDTGTHDRRAQ